MRLKCTILTVLTIAIGLQATPVHAGWWQTLTAKIYEHPKTAAGFIFLGYSSLHAICSALWYFTRTQKIKPTVDRKIAEHETFFKKALRAEETLTEKKKELVALEQENKQLQTDNELLLTRLAHESSCTIDGSLTEKLTALQKETMALTHSNATTRNKIRELTTEEQQLSHKTKEEEEYTQLVSGYNVSDIACTTFAQVEKSAKSAIANAQSILQQDLTTKMTQNKEAITALQQTIKQALVDALSELDSFLNRRLSYDEIGQKYDGNFGYIAAPVANAYALLNLDWQLARLIPFKTMQLLIDAIKDRECKRTLKKLLPNKLEKENFDAFLRGEGTWMEFKKKSVTNCDEKRAHENVESKYDNELMANCAHALEPLKQQLTNLWLELDTKMRKESCVTRQK